MSITARELIEPLQTELNLAQLFGMRRRSLVGHCILTMSHLQLMRDDVYPDCSWKSLYTDDPLPLKKKNKLTAQDETDRADQSKKVDVEVIGLPINTDGITFTITGSHSDCV